MSKIMRIWRYDWEKSRLWAGEVLWAARAIAKEEVRAIMRLRAKPRFWIIMIVLTALVFCASFAAMRHRYAQTDRRLRQAQSRRDELVLQTNALSDQLTFAQTDDYVIRVARDELGMIMPGEVRYVNGAR